MKNIQNLIAEVTTQITTAMCTSDLAQFHILSNALAIISHAILDIQTHPSAADFIIETNKIINKLDDVKLKVSLRHDLFKLIAEMEEYFGRGSKRVDIVFIGDRSTIREVEKINDESGRNFYIVDDLEENNTLHLDLLCIRDLMHIQNRLMHYNYDFNIVN